jgi:hypothetical protein
MSSSDHTHTATIAAALRRLAARLDAAGDIEIANTWLSVGLQVTSYGQPATAACRVATVDALCALLDMTADYDDGDYRRPTEQSDRVPGLDVAVYAPHTDPAVAGAR